MQRSKKLTPLIYELSQDPPHFHRLKQIQIVAVLIYYRMLLFRCKYNIYENSIKKNVRHLAEFYFRLDLIRFELTFLDEIQRDIENLHFSNCLTK